LGLALVAIIEASLFYQMNKYRFYKNEVEWFVDLPEYLEKGGSISNLEMVEGADTMLDIMSAGKKEVILNMSTEKLDNSDRLTLKEKCEPLKGGAYYFMKEFEGKEINLTMWLCQVVEFEFGEIPTNIFVRREQ
jgi:hypothetical protein